MKARTLTLAASTLVLLAASVASAGGNHRQPVNDLFYNYYVGPQPSGSAAQIYVSPLPIPAHTGHTYTTYQPLMPHEFMYGHMNAYHHRHPGAGWTRTNVRYGTHGAHKQAMHFGLYDNTFFGWLREGAFNTRVVKPWRL